MNKNRKLINALLVSTMMLSGLASTASAADGASVERIGGNTRVETAVSVSTHAYDKADTVVLAGYNGQVDALTGTALASSMDVPLLLVSEQADHVAAVGKEILRLEAKNVVLLGSTNVISKQIEDGLTSTGLNVSRVAGDDRFDTAVAVAKKVDSKTGHAFLAYDGRNGVLADALAAGPASGMKNSPILLTSTDKLPAQTKAALTDLNISEVTIVGGTSAVSNGIVEELKAMDIAVERVFGDNRWETAEAVAGKYFAEADKAIIANDGYTGSYADALVGGYFGAKHKMPVLLTQVGGLTEPTKNFLGSKAMYAYVLGSEGVVSKAALEETKAIVDKNIAENVLEVESVSAINAKTLEVKFNNAVSKEDQAKVKFEVKRGTVKPAVKAPVFSEDGKSATIESNVALAAGDYTVTVTGLTEESLTGTAKVEAEKIVNISFLTKEAVKKTNDILTRVVAENQYGEDVTSKLNTSTNSNITVTASKGTAPHSIDKDGNLKVAGTTPTDFKVDDKVVVTIVDSNTGITATQTLTVVQAANVESIVLGELTTDDEELAKEAVNVENMDVASPKYYVPVTIKDQYGNTLKASELDGVSVVSSNNSIVKPKASPFKDTKNGTIIELDQPTGTATHGTAVLTVISASTGKTANVSIVVKENSKLDVVTLEAASTLLKDGVDAVLPTSIINSYGEEVNLKDVTVGGNNTANMTLDTNTKISAIGATLKVEQDYVNKKAILKVTPSQTNVTITVVTATGKSQVLNLVAEAAPVVTAIKGLDKDFVSVLANDDSLETNLKDAVEFSDQYGEDIGAPTYDQTDGTSALDYTILEKDVSNTVATYTKATGIIKPSTTAGTKVFEVVLKDASNKVLDKLDVAITVVDKDKITEFGINELNKFYTGAVSSAHNQQVVVHGLHNGNKVKVNQSMVADVTANNGLDIAANGSYTAKLIDTKNEDVTSTLTALVANAENTYTVTKDVVYNSSAPKTQSVVAKYDGVDVKGGVAQVPFAELNKSIVPGVGTASKLQFVAKDQYGVQRVGSDYKVVTTNRNTAGNFDSAGSGTNFVAGDSGKSLQLNVRVDGILEAVKVIVE